MSQRRKRHIAEFTARGVRTQDPGRSALVLAAEADLTLQCQSPIL